MSLAKLVPNDPRVQHCTAVLNGRTYKYMLGLPVGDIKGTIFLIHGWPDLSFGWRNQIPLLTSLGLRVVVPDMMGYGGTDAPTDLSNYTYKRAADDLATLASQLSAPQILLGGHDWGGIIIYKFALWYPHLITSLFSICTPYMAPSLTYTPISDLVSTTLPNFKYQLQFQSPEVEEKIQSKEDLRAFFKAIFGGRTPDGEGAFSVERGIIFSNLGKVTKSRVISDTELDYYVSEYSRNGLRGPLNWYRTRKLNFEDEKELAEKGVRIECPAMFVQAENDAALPPWMARNMDRHFARGLRVERVGGSHWCLWEKVEECNGFIGSWVEGQLGGKVRKSSL